MKGVPKKSKKGHQSILVVSLLLSFVAFLPCSILSAGEGDEGRDLFALQIEDLMGLKVATVYGASKFEQKVTEAPSAISIVTSEDIKRFGYRTLADILRNQRGFYITNDRNYQYVGVRGLSRPGDFNTRILLLVNGHRTNDNIYNQAMLGNGFVLDVDLIDRIEIIRGPGSSLYGSNAFFGTINVITKRGRDIGGTEVAASAGSWDTYSGRATFGQKFSNGLETLISATGYDSKGQNFHFTNPEFDTPENNDGWADHCDKEKAANFFARASFKNLSFESAYVSREKWVPTSAWGTMFNSGQDKTIDTRGYLNLAFNRTFENGLEVLARISYDFYQFDGYYLFADPPPSTMNRDRVLGNWWGSDVMLSRRLGARHLVVGGAEYERSTRQLQENYTRSPAYTYLHDNHGSEILGLYLQDEITLRDDLTLSAGLRYDHYTTFGSSTNPRLTLVYTPVPTMIIKALYGQAFRAPNVYELYYNDGNQYSKANPSLKPEKMSTYELVLEKYFRNGLHFTASAYYYKVRDIITQVTDADDLLVFRNMGDVTGKGLELEVEKTWPKDISLRVSQAFQYAKDDSTGTRAANSPASLSTLNLTLPLIGSKLYGGLDAQYVSRRHAPEGGCVPGYWLAKITLLAKDVVKNLDLSGAVYNLFDQTVKYPTSNEFRQRELIGDGISFRIKAQYRF